MMLQENFAGFFRFQSLN